MQVTVTARDGAGHTASDSATYTVTSPPPPSGGVFVPYSEDSFFKSRVAGAPVNAARTAEFLNFTQTHVDQRNVAFPYINGLTASSWGTAYSKGVAGDPIWKLTGNVNAKAQILETVGFHGPDNLGQLLTGTSDSPFCVQDMVNGFTVFGTKANQVGDRLIQVDSGGITYHDSNGLDGRNTRSDDSRNWTSRGRISEALVIRRELVDQAIANGTGLGHVLQMFIAETDQGHCHPMVGDEGNRNGFGAEGERLCIKPTVDLTTRGLSPFGLCVARTLQEHGCYIGDNAGNMSVLKAEQRSSINNPWAGLAVSQQALSGLTWNDFVVIEQGWQ